MDLEIKRLAQLRGLEIMFDEQEQHIKKLNEQLARVEQERDAYKYALEELKASNARMKMELYGEAI